MADKKNTIETEIIVNSKAAVKGVKAVGESTEDLAKKVTKAKSSFEELDGATGGLISKFKALSKNPIALTMAALVGIFTTLKKAVGRSGKASATFGKITAKLSGVFNGFLAVLEPVVEFLGDKLLSALNDPQQAIKDLGKYIQESLINRVKSFLVMGEAFAELMKGNFSEATKLAADGVLQFATGVTDATDKMTKFGGEAKKRFEEAAKATNDLAGAEKALVRNRIALEKQQLISLRLAEKERQIRDDTSKSMDERQAANKRLGKILDEQSIAEMKIAKQSLSLAYAKQAADGQTLESIEAIGDAEIKLLEIQERITGQRSEQLVNEIGLIKEREDLKKKTVEDAEKQRVKEEEEAEKKRKKEEEAKKLGQETQNELDELEIERLKEKGDKTLNLELELLERKRLQDVAASGLTAKQIQLIGEEAEFAKKKLRKITEKAEDKKEKAILDSAINGAAEAFGISQEVALARMLMAAPEAVGNVWSQAAKQPTLPQMFLHGAVGTATTLAPIVKGISDIKSTKFSKSKGGVKGGGATPSGSSGGGSAPSNVTPELIGDLASNNAANLGTNTELGNGALSSASAGVSGGASGNVVFSEDSYQNFTNQVKFKEGMTTV